MIVRGKEALQSSQPAATSSSAPWPLSPWGANLWNLGSCAADAPIGFFWSSTGAETELSVTVTALSGMLRNLPTRTQVRRCGQCGRLLSLRLMWRQRTQPSKPAFHPCNKIFRWFLFYAEIVQRWQIKCQAHYLRLIKKNHCEGEAGQKGRSQRGVAL